MEPVEKCQICDSILKTEDEFTAENHSTIFPFYPSRWQRICSTKCQLEAIEFNACWRMKTKIKNMSPVPFETFNDHFKFNEDGGYAMRWWYQMRGEPLMFLFKLDFQNFKKFMNWRLS